MNWLRGALNRLYAAGSPADKQALFEERRERNLASSQRLIQRSVVLNNSCDVICKAANEGAYITEFIHHHLLLGFRHLFIGVNNDSSELTGRIVKRISRHYPNVHVLNTDRDHRRHGYLGSYCRLYETASRTTDSSHMLVIDVDEYWISTIPRQTISEYLAQQKPFQILSFNWINLRGGNAFTRPLDTASARASSSTEFKSLFRYDQIVVEVKDHAPLVQSKRRERMLHRSADQTNLQAKQLKPWIKPRRSSPKTPSTSRASAWILHRFIRSECEYAARLFQRKASSYSKPIPFKENRPGYQLGRDNPKIRAVLTAMQPPETGPETIPCLDAFISQCNLQGLIAEARQICDEQQIRQQISSLDPAVVNQHAAVWRRTFKGTRFLPMLEERARQ